MLRTVSYPGELKDYIMIFDDVLDKETCSGIISEYEKSSLWSVAGVGVENKVDSQTRNCDALHISSAKVIEENPDLRKTLDDKIFNAVSGCLNNYKQKFPALFVTKDTGYELLRYKTAGFYIEHIDHFEERQRAVTVSIILNDNFEGGEFSFFNKEIVVPAKTGQAIMFPSNFMFPHGVMPVRFGKRYAIVTWFF